MGTYIMIIQRFGQVFISTGDECRLVSEVNVLGHIAGEPRALAAVRAGASIRVERVE